MNKLILYILFVSIFLCGCISNNLENIIDKKEYILSDNPKITIGFNNGLVFGSGGVNQYSGSYFIKNGRITFINIGATMMMGAESDMDNESKYLQSLKDNLSIKVDKENNLIIDKYIFIEKHK